MTGPLVKSYLNSRVPKVFVCRDAALLQSTRQRQKTKFVIFGSRPLVSKIEGLHLSLLSKELTPAKSAKDLSVILDSNLTYEDHVTKTVSTCMSRLGQINRLKHVVIQVGGAVASWLVRSSPDQAVRVRALAGDIVLCS